MTTRYRQSWHVLNEQTFAFDYDFTLSMPDYKVTGDGDSFKEYEGTIKASGKDMADAKKKAEKELMRRIDSAEKATKGSLEDNISSILQTGKAVSEGLKEFTLVHVVRYRDPLNKKRFVVEMPMPLAKTQSVLMSMLPIPPMLTIDQCKILSEADNIVSNNHLTLEDLNVKPSDVEEAMKKWLWRYRDGGQFAKVQ